MEDIKRRLLPQYEVKGMDALTEEALESLKQDERVYSLIRDKFHLTVAETKAALVMLLEYASDLKSCDNCPGVANCQKENTHYQMELVSDDGLIVPLYHLCPKQKAVETYENSFLRHDFPSQWNDCTLKKDVERTIVKKPLLVESQKILMGKSKRWLYVQGSRRSGRTFTLACLCNDLARKGLGPIAFVDTAKLLEELRSLAFSKQKEEFHSKMQELIDCYFLVFDDFGNEAKDKTGFGFSSILFPILNGRAKANKLTAFSSDFSISEIAEMYQSSLGVPRAKQFKNLLLDTCGSGFDISSLPIH